MLCIQQWDNNLAGDPRKVRYALHKAGGVDGFYFYDLKRRGNEKRGEISANLFLDTKHNTILVWRYFAALALRFKALEYSSAMQELIDRSVSTK